MKEQKLEVEERHVTAVGKIGNKIKSYHNHEKNEFIMQEEIIGLDANVLVDMADDKYFKAEIKDQVKFNVLNIFTTDIALGEARHVLMKKRKYSWDDATKELKNLLNEFSIKKVIHNDESDKIGDGWVNIVKKSMYIKKLNTFPNDCKILANLVNQVKINAYYTEDKDIEKAVKILNLKVKVRIIPSAQNLNNSKIKEFFNQRRNPFYKKNKRF